MTNLSDELKSLSIDLSVVPSGPVLDVSPGGSRWICNPPVMDTDIDLNVLIRGEFGPYLQTLLKNGWDVNICDADYMSPKGEHPFVTARKGLYNLIILNSAEGYGYIVEATKIAKKLNVLDKEDRVQLFGLIRGGRISTRAVPLPF